MTFLRVGDPQTCQNQEADHAAVVVLLGPDPALLIVA